MDLLMNISQLEFWWKNIGTSRWSIYLYDIIIVRKKEDDSEDIIRAQVKTAKQSVPFTGGGRGGVDREYKSDVKTYTQSTATSDVVIGVHPAGDNAFELYFVPTILVEELNRKSISINKIADLKENYDILENCKNRKVVIEKCREYGILSSEPRSLC